MGGLQGGRPSTGSGEHTPLRECGSSGEDGWLEFYSIRQAVVEEREGVGRGERKERGCIKHHTPIQVLHASTDCCKDISTGLALAQLMAEETLWVVSKGEEFPQSNAKAPDIRLVGKLMWRQQTLWGKPGPGKNRGTSLCTALLMTGLSSCGKLTRRWARPCYCCLGSSPCRP